MCKDFSYAATNSVNGLCLIINKINGYIEERNENEYLTLDLNDESKSTLKSMKNYGSKSNILLDQ